MFSLLNSRLDRIVFRNREASQNQLVSPNCTRSLRVFFSLMAFFPLLLACTGEKNPSGNFKSSGPSALSAKDESLKGKLTSETSQCSVENVAHFDSAEGETIDLTRDQMPRGLYLAQYSEFIIEKKSETGIARAIFRESAGAKSAEVICADSFERVPPEAIDIAMTGLVKFDLSGNSSGVGFTQRQFFFYQNKSGFGANFSNPKSLLNSGSIDLKRFLSAQAPLIQVVRLSDKLFLLKYSRETEGVRGRLHIHLELIQ